MDIITELSAAGKDTVDRCLVGTAHCYASRNVYIGFILGAITGSFRLELKWSHDKFVCKCFYFLCVCMWSDWGWRLGEGANFPLSLLAEELKVWCFGVVRSLEGAV